MRVMCRSSADGRAAARQRERLRQGAGEQRLERRLGRSLPARVRREAGVARPIVCGPRAAASFIIRPASASRSKALASGSQEAEHGERLAAVGERGGAHRAGARPLAREQIPPALAFRQLLEAAGSGGFRA